MSGEGQMGFSSIHAVKFLASGGHTARFKSIMTLHQLWDHIMAQHSTAQHMAQPVVALYTVKQHSRSDQSTA